MKYINMQKRMKEIVTDVARKYEGGESYFTELDEMIRGDEHLLVSFIDFIVENKDANIVASGKFGEKIYEMMQQNLFNGEFMLILVSGGLRSGAEAMMEAVCCNTPVSLQRKYVFVDDSYYSGKTADVIAKKMNKSGFHIDSIFVMYDGCPERKKEVESLYRYYGGEK